MTIWLNAFSPLLGQNAFTQIQLATSTTLTQSTFTIGRSGGWVLPGVPPYLNGFVPYLRSPDRRCIQWIRHFNILVKQNTGKSPAPSRSPQGTMTITRCIFLTALSSGSRLTSGPGIRSSFERASIPGCDVSHNGAQIQTSVAVTNGQIQTLNLNLSVPTYALPERSRCRAGFP